MMTDRKTAAEQLFGPAAAGQSLTEGEELLAAFLRSSNVGVGIPDSNLRYLAVNKVLAEMHGSQCKTTWAELCARFWARLANLLNASYRKYWQRDRD